MAAFSLQLLKFENIVLKINKKIFRAKNFNSNLNQILNYLRHYTRRCKSKLIRNYRITFHFHLLCCISLFSFLPQKLLHLLLNRVFRFLIFLKLLLLENQVGKAAFPNSRSFLLLRSKLNCFECDIKFSHNVEKQLRRLKKLKNILTEI